MKNNIVSTFKVLYDNALRTQSLQIPEKVGQLFANQIKVMDIFCNTKRSELNPFVNSGEQITICYEDKKVMNIFCGYIARVAIGNDDVFKYQPPIEMLQTCKSVLFCSCQTNDLSENTHNEAIKHYVYDKGTTFDCLISEIQKDIIFRNTDLVIIDDLSIFDVTNNNIQENLLKLSVFADKNKIIIISGIKICPNNIENIQNSLSGKERNIAYLNAIHDNKLGTYCTINYGYPDIKTMPFEIEKNYIVASGIMNTIRYNELFKKYANFSISIKKLTIILFGALHGDIAQKTIENEIKNAIENGMLLQSGKNVVYKECMNTRKSYCSTTVITAFSNKEKEGKRKRIAFINFKETKIIIGEGAVLFAEAILKSIVDNKVNIDFRCKTDHKNILIISITNISHQNKINEIKKKYQNDLNHKALEIGINEKEFYNKFVENIDICKPDIVFVLGMENIMCDKSTNLYSDICKFVKYRNIACIVSYNTFTQRFKGIDEENVCTIEEFDDNVFDLKTITKGKHLLITAKKISNNLIHVDYQEKAKIFYKNFFWVDNDEFGEGMSTIEGEIITKRHITAGVRYGIIKCVGKGKYIKI